MIPKEPEAEGLYGSNVASGDQSPKPNDKAFLIFLAVCAALLVVSLLW